METQTLSQSPAFEKSLIQIVRKLHPKRALQVLDFARWLQTQPVVDELSGEEITRLELELEEEAWERVYLANRDTFLAMAQEALEDLEAGNTLEMVLEDGKVSAR